MMALRSTKNLRFLKNKVLTRSKTKWLVLPVVSLCVAGNFYAHSEDRSNGNWRSTLSGIARIANLVNTVVLISGDFMYTKYLVDNGDDESKGIKKALKEARDDHEKIQIRRWTNVGAPNEQELIDDVTNSIKRMQLLSDRLLELEDANPQSPYHEVFLRSAVRLHKLCERNGGVYIKLGQHLAQLDYLLPMEFIVELRRLLGDTPQSSYEAVKRTVFEDMGKVPEDLWASFDPIPIASASLAQVHVAYGHDGTKYAVKVQHENLKMTAADDMRAVTLMVNIVSKLFEDFSYKWLAREMNTNLPLELNFNHEASNIHKCRELLAPLIKSGELALPTVYSSTERVLVMSFEEGWYLTDTAKMEQSGVDPAEVAHLVSKTFCEQIYRYGFVHCDPHTANVLVRVRPGSREGKNHSPKAQIVLLDHGLYRELDDKFRRDYCRLWRGIVTSNVKDIETYCREMNAGDMYPLLSAMLTLRAWDDIVSRDMSRLQNKGTKSESERIRFYAQRYMKQIVALMESVPSALLLLLKTNDCLRQLDKSVGAPINTMAVVAEITADVIFKEELQASTSVAMTYEAYRKYIQLESRVLLLQSAGAWLALSKYATDTVSWIGRSLYLWK